MRRTTKKIIIDTEIKFIESERENQTKNGAKGEISFFFLKMQGQQPVLRQTDQSPILQQSGNIVIKMNENIQPITTVGKFHCTSLTETLKISL